jgi:hypothetical protein
MQAVTDAGTRCGLPQRNNTPCSRKEMAEKKFKTKIGGKTIKFGAKGYSIAPGTPKGDRYCARSSGIKKCAKPPCKNDLSRQAWGCVGKKSVKSKAKKFKRV